MGRVLAATIHIIVAIIFIIFLSINIYNYVKLRDNDKIGNGNRVFMLWFSVTLLVVSVLLILWAAYVLIFRRNRVNAKKREIIEIE